jgi:phosphate transport system protein
LDSLEREILTLAAMVESMIDKACRALHKRDAKLAADVIEADAEVDKREVHIEEECLKILALHQPVAVDLRQTATVMKINNDLERIADLAVNISERANSLLKLARSSTSPQPSTNGDRRAPPRQTWFEPPSQLETMEQLAVVMVRDALDAFVRLDPDTAKDVCGRDDEVDDINRELIDELCAIMWDDPSKVEAAMQYFSAARHIERIADHATNIAEDVTYLVEGEISRHRHELSHPDQQDE